jgi:hypothetical protein
VQSNGGWEGVSVLVALDGLVSSGEEAEERDEVRLCGRLNDIKSASMVVYLSHTHCVVTCTTQTNVVVVVVQA